MEDTNSRSKQNNGSSINMKKRYDIEDVSSKKMNSYSLVTMQFFAIGFSIPSYNQAEAAKGEGN